MRDSGYERERDCRAVHVIIIMFLILMKLTSPVLFGKCYKCCRSYCELLIHSCLIFLRMNVLAQSDSAVLKCSIMLLKAPGFVLESRWQVCMHQGQKHFHFLIIYTLFNASEMTHWMNQSNSPLYMSLLYCGEHAGTVSVTELNGGWLM